MPVKAGESTPTNPTGARLPTTDVPDAISRDRWGRPLIEPASGSGKATAYTRASTIGGVLEDQYGLGQWRMRQVAYGLSRRRDLLLAVQALKSADGADDKRELGKLADLALEAAESSAAATIGTAIHALSERVDRGEDVGHVDGEARDALDAYLALTEGFAMAASETFTVCDEHRVAGTFDRLLIPKGPMLAPDGTRIEAGTPLIGDLKTSGTAAYFGIKFAVQLAEYAHGVPYLPGVGRMPWASLSDHGSPHPEWGLIVHVPTGNPAGSGLHWVDLASGRELTDLAVAVKEQRARKDLVVPASGPSLPDPLTSRGLLSLVKAADSREAIDRLWRPNRKNGLWTDEHTEAAKVVLGRLASVSA
jgi:hypothetical protein